jgi:hypothetical protein
VDLTGRHAPSQLILEPWYEWLQNDFHKHLSYRRHELSERERDMILGLVSGRNSKWKVLIEVINSVCIIGKRC